MHRVRNLTGQDVRLVNPAQRAATTHHPWTRTPPPRVVTGKSTFHGIKVVTTWVEGLPPREEGVILIVTPEVFAACDRSDLFTPTQPCEGGWLALRQTSPLASHAVTTWVDVEKADIAAVGRAMVELLEREEERPGVNLAYRAALVAARTTLDHVCRYF